MQTMRILDTSNIQPLDVILGRTAGTAGKAIAKTTGGNYSHAALVIDRSCVFESGLAGVTFRPLDIVSAGFVGGKVVIGVNVADFDVIDIWRHPDLRTMETDALASLRSEALDVAALHNCREYPSLETFRNYITGKYPRRGNRMMELMKAKIPRKALAPITATAAIIRKPRSPLLIILSITWRINQGTASPNPVVARRQIKPSASHAQYFRIKTDNRSRLFISRQQIPT